MNPSMNIVNPLVDDILKQAKVSLDNLFCAGKIDLSLPFVVDTFDCNHLVYEDPYTHKVYLDLNEQKGEEYFVYALSTIFKKFDLNTIIMGRYDETYQLKLKLVFNTTTEKFELTYDPTSTMDSVMHVFKDLALKEHMLKEFLETTHHFSNMKFHNHNTGGRFMQGIPKLTLSISGCIFNRPNREYYIVFGEGYDTYTVQVYKLKADTRRECMLYGFWVNATAKKIYDPYVY